MPVFPWRISRPAVLAARIIARMYGARRSRARLRCKLGWLDAKDWTERKVQGVALHTPRWQQRTRRPAQGLARTADAQDARPRRTLSGVPSRAAAGPVKAFQTSFFLHVAAILQARRESSDLEIIASTCRSCACVASDNDKAAPQSRRHTQCRNRSGLGEIKASGALELRSLGGLDQGSLRSVGAWTPSEPTAASIVRVNIVHGWGLPWMPERSSCSISLRRICIAGPQVAGSRKISRTEKAGPAPHHVWGREEQESGC